MTDTILIIDDEADIRDLLADIFEDEGYKVLKAAHSEQALALLEQHKIDLVVLDIWLDNSDMDGIQILKHIKQKDIYKALPILMISGHGNVEMAVNAMKMGAFDFIEKPFKIDHILLTVQRALEQKHLREENNRLKHVEFTEIGELESSIKSPTMQKIMKDLEAHCESDARVMVSGAIGTGKMRYARMIHSRSKRQGHVLSVINAIDFETDLFTKTIENNDKGTIILRCVHLLNASHQAALLNILNTMDDGVRIVVTCDDGIDDMVSRGDFSSALYDRLSIIRVDLPQLSKRMDDFDDLAQDCFQTLQQELNLADDQSLSQNQINHLKGQDWPGNIRQLKAAIELLIHQGDMNTGQLLSKPAQNPVQNPVQNKVTKVAHGVPLTAAANDDGVHVESGVDHYTSMPLKQAREKFEYEYLSQVLKIFDGNIAKMATFVEMDRAALHRKLKSMNIGIEKKA